MVTFTKKSLFAALPFDSVGVTKSICGALVSIVVVKFDVVNIFPA
ncbi:MAG: hypothetical protein AABX16_03300 [Nanoarchaeota archaeon]